MGIIIWLLIGLLTALVARYIVPSADPIGVWDALVLGLVGSLMGGFVATLVFEGGVQFATSGVAGSLVGSVAMLLVTRSGSDHVTTL